jgi:hypothetical protein
MRQGGHIGADTPDHERSDWPLVVLATASHFCCAAACFSTASSEVTGIKQAGNRPVDLHELVLVVPALDASLVLVFGGIVDDAGGQVPLDALRLGLRSRRRGGFHHRLRRERALLCSDSDDGIGGFAKIPHFGTNQTKIPHFGTNQTKIPHFGTNQTKIPHFGTNQTKIPHFGKEENEDTSLREGRKRRYLTSGRKKTKIPVRTFFQKAGWP